MQQHGSVYWKCGAKEMLANLQPSQSMHDQLKVLQFCTSSRLSIYLLNIKLLLNEVE